MNIVHGGVNTALPPRAVWRGVRPPLRRWRRLLLLRVECTPTQRGWLRATRARVRRAIVEQDGGACMASMGTLSTLQQVCLSDLSCIWLISKSTDAL